MCTKKVYLRPGCGRVFNEPRTTTTHTMQPHCPHDSPAISLPPPTTLHLPSSHCGARRTCIRPIWQPRNTVYTARGSDKNKQTNKPITTRQRDETKNVRRLITAEWRVEWKHFGVKKHRGNCANSRFEYVLLYCLLSHLCFAFSEHSNRLDSISSPLHNASRPFNIARQKRIPFSKQIPQFAKEVEHTLQHKIIRKAVKFTTSSAAFVIYSLRMSETRRVRPR